MICVLRLERRSVMGIRAMNLSCAQILTLTMSGLCRIKNGKSPRRTPVAACAVLCGLLTACVSTQTDPIRDAGGHAIAGSIATLERVALGGVEQWILIRGRNASKPLVLKLHGGPG